MARQAVIAITDASLVGAARRAATRISEAAGLNETQRGQVAIVVTELANNLAKYAQNGQLMLQTLQTSRGPIVEVLSVDSGPGIANVQRSLQDGFSTGGTPGNGLGAVQRLSNEFDLFSTVGQGTIILSRIGATSPEFQWGAVCIAIAGEIACGDSWQIAERDGELNIMMVDGLGHGVLASQAAEAADKAFLDNPAATPAAAVENCHAALHGSRGAAIAVAAINSKARTMEYAGVGNISGSLASPTTSRGLVSHNGIVGVQMRKVQQFSFTWPPQGVLIMHSDGVQQRWRLENYPGLITRHPGIIAAVLHRDFARGRDDATALVVRLTP